MTAQEFWDKWEPCDWTPVEPEDETKKEWFDDLFALLKQAVEEEREIWKGRCGVCGIGSNPGGTWMRCGMCKVDHWTHETFRGKAILDECHGCKLRTRKEES